jgi:hypothetical protein
MFRRAGIHVKLNGRWASYRAQTDAPTSPSASREANTVGGPPDLGSERRPFHGTDTTNASWLAGSIRIESPATTVDEQQEQMIRRIRGAARMSRDEAEFGVRPDGRTPPISYNVGVCDRPKRE